MKKIILLILASLTFLTAEDVKIKSAGTDANDGVVFKNSLDSTLVDIDGTGVMNIKGIPSAGATLRLFEAFGNGSNYLQLNPGVSLAENATWSLSSAGGLGNMFLGYESVVRFFHLVRQILVWVIMLPRRLLPVSGMWPWVTRP